MEPLTGLLPDPWPHNPWPTRFRTVRTSAPELTEPGLTFVTVASPALGGRGDLALWAPPTGEAGASHGVEAAPDRPLVILLHGVYSSFWNWILVGGAHRIAAAMIAEGEIAPVAIVAASDGQRGEGTAYLSTPGLDVERWILDDVVACAVEAGIGVTEQSPLLLCGNSMGGYGALRLGARHPERVAAISAHSAVTDLDAMSAFVATPFDPTAVADHDLATLLPSVAGLPPLRFDCGTDDPLLEHNRRLHAALDAVGVEHGYDEPPGGHDWPYWTRQLADSLRFFDGIVAGVRS